MPARMKPSEVLKEMEWLKELPDEGGSWGKGLVSTGKAIVSEVAQLELTRSGLSKQIGDRLRVLRALPGRAVREAPLMFDEETVGVALLEQGDG